ncbi:MAG: glycosyltransferase family 4 protein [bacterium]|nr:glycosyltransferase family 4 protein [bacterium]
MNKKVKLLIITQKVDKNDDVLGFFHRWIEEFTKHCEKVTVICLQKGDYDLPENTKVLSLGKEKNLTTGYRLLTAKLKYIFNFYKYIFRERKNYDTVFVHMNPEYVILGAPFWKLWGKKIALWYAHGAVPFTLKLAEKMTDIVFTSTKSGFRLVSKKKKVVGQGVDTEKFQPRPEAEKKPGIFKIISIGRISPVKDYKTLIDAIEILEKQGVKLNVDIVGAAGLPEQEKYLSDLKETVARKNISGVINFVGAVSNKDIAARLQSADLFVNMSHTGSMDKAILEAMACGLPILTCNEALLEVLGEYKEKLMYPKKDFKALAEKISRVIGETGEERKKLGMGLREIVVRNHGTAGLIAKIMASYK